jgi:hypothetical protein
MLSDRGLDRRRRRNTFLVIWSQWTEAGEKDDIIKMVAFIEAATSGASYLST